MTKFRPTKAAPINLLLPKLATAPAALRSLKFYGKDQKPILTREALKRGVNIINRVMVSDLVPCNGCIGAVGVHTREEKVIGIRAKSVALGTGILTGLYPSPTPEWMFNIGRSPVTTGDGRAMDYRSGAELVG